MELSWFQKQDAYQQAGNYYGYALAILRTKDAMKKLGVQFSPKSPIHFSYCAPHAYEYFPGKTNVLFTMYESSDMEKGAVSRIQKADLIIVPSEYCLRAFRKLTKKPVYKVPLGIDHIPYQPRDIENDKPFRFLWLGAWNPRKGWGVIGEAWDRYFGEFPFCELYIKTTSHGKDVARQFKRGNSIIDGRNVSKEEMSQIYYDAHCFVLPTMGEGWGQSNCEAMSSGCPVITTAYSGVLEYANSRNCTFSPHKVYRIEASMGGPSQAPDGKYEFAMSDIDGLAKSMANLMNDYENATIKAKRAAKEIREFTWERSAKGILDVIRKAA